MKQYDVEIQLRRLVFQGTRQWLADGRRIKSLAIASGVLPKTVSKLAYGETKYPRFHTVLAVCDALGIELTVKQLFPAQWPKQGARTGQTR